MFQLNKTMQCSTLLSFSKVALAGRIYKTLGKRFLNYLLREVCYMQRKIEGGVVALN